MKMLQNIKDNYNMSNLGQVLSLGLLLNLLLLLL